MKITSFSKKNSARSLIDVGGVWCEVFIDRDMKKMFFLHIMDNINENAEKLNSRLHLEKKC